MRLSFAAAVVLIGLLAGCSGEKTSRKAEVKLEGVTTRKKQVRPWTTAKAAFKTEKSPTPVPNSTVVEQAVKQLNDNRSRLGLVPLNLHPTLNRLAQEYAELLAKEKKADAIPGGKNLPDRIKEGGYAFANLGVQTSSTRDPATAETVNGFLKQPGMAAGLATAVDIGIGIAPGTDGNNYIVLVHGTPLKM